MRIVKLDEASMKNILADMLKRDPNNYDAYTETVQEIVDKVKVEGDRAVLIIPENLIKHRSMQKISG